MIRQRNNNYNLPEGQGRLWDGIFWGSPILIPGILDPLKSPVKDPRSRRWGFGIFEAEKSPITIPKKTPIPGLGIRDFWGRKIPIKSPIKNPQKSKIPDLGFLNPEISPIPNQPQDTSALGWGWWNFKTSRIPSDCTQVKQKYGQKFEVCIFLAAKICERQDTGIELVLLIDPQFWN